MSVTLLIDYWLIAITALFVVVNPLTTAFIFVSLLPNANAAQRARAAKRSTLVSAGIFLLFGLLGSFIFKVFGITLEAFRIAGGLILFGIAMSMMQKGLDDGEEATGKEPLRMFLFDSGEDKPFTAGKFAIPTAMMAAVGGRNIMDDVDASWGTVAWEAVAARNPEFLVLLDYQNDGGADKLLQFLQKHPLMQHTTAVKNKRFVALRYEELTPGPANVAAIEKMARAVNR